MYECSHCIICDEGAAASACISRSQPETRKVHWKHAHLHHIQRARATAKISNAAPTAAGNPAPFRSMIYSGDERRFFFPPHKIWHVSQPLGITVTSHIFRSGAPRCVYNSSSPGHRCASQLSRLATTAAIFMKGCTRQSLTCMLSWPTAQTPGEKAGWWPLTSLGTAGHPASRSTRCRSAAVFEALLAAASNLAA